MGDLQVTPSQQGDESAEVNPLGKQISRTVQDTVDLAKMQIQAGVRNPKRVEDFEKVLKGLKTIAMTLPGSRENIDLINKALQDLKAAKVRQVKAEPEIKHIGADQVQQVVGKHMQMPKDETSLKYAEPVPTVASTAEKELEKPVEKVEFFAELLQICIMIGSGLSSSEKIEIDQALSQNEDGDTALHRFCSWLEPTENEVQGFPVVNIVEILQKNLTPEQLKSRNNDGESVADLACKNGLKVVVDALVKNGAIDLFTEPNANGDTALHLLCSLPPDKVTKDHIEVAKLLVEKLVESRNPALSSRNNDEKTIFDLLKANPSSPLTQAVSDIVKKYIS